MTSFNLNLYVLLEKTNLDGQMGREFNYKCHDWEICWGDDEELFYSFIMAMITRLYTFVKNYKTLHKRRVNFTICNFKITLKIVYSTKRNQYLSFIYLR